MENKARILVVDDEESIRFTFETFLLDEGYSVITAANYDEAMALFAGSVFDLVFADILLGGGWTGVDLMREARKLNRDCPFVVVTGAPNVETASEAVRLGAFDYIAKPVHQETLLRVAKMALKNKALIDEKEKYRLNLEAIFWSVKDAIITVDEELRVVELNRAAEKICGVTRDVIGRVFNLLDAGCRRNCLDAFVETISKKKPVEMFHVECHHKNRSGHVVSLSTSPLLDHQGLFSGAVIVIRDETRLYDLERDLKERRQFHNIIGTGEKMQEIYSLIENLADVQTTVLITGESGTGKELAAEALHYKGIRSHKPLVKVNCSALSESLLESELFGHVKGAFTGAVKDKVGRFQRADKGTIFLDEIGDISHRIQLRLLRVLQEMEFERVGDSTPIKVDVRVIAATNQDLSAKIRRGEFREDLFYRLRVVEITIPPLRDRREDIPFLIDHFIEKFNKKLDKDIKAVSGDVQKIFMEYSWPGNIRELEHTLEHAFILCRQNTITLDHLPGNFKGSSAVRALAQRDAEGNETQKILQALEKTGGNKAKAARLLGFDRKTLYRKIERFNIPKKHE
jgi:two-component system response regulator HydG